MGRWRSVGWTVSLCGALLTVPAACGRADGALDDAHPHTRAVLAALDDERPLELRLNDGTSFRPCTAARDSADVTHARSATYCAPVGAGTAERLAQLAVKIAADTAAAGSTDVLWATAILDLASGTAASLAQVERAILHLTEVHAREPQLLLPHNHLAIAHRIRASQRQEVRELHEALDLLEAALEDDSTSVVLRYNRALLESALDLSRVAATDWQAVAAAEQDGAWRRDAELRLRTGGVVGAAPSRVAQAAVMSSPSAPAGIAVANAGMNAAPTLVTGSRDLDALVAQAQQLSGASLHRAAARVLQEARLVALATHRAQDVPEILGRLAITEAQRGRTSSALALVADARRLATAVVPADSREHVAAGLDRAEAMAMEVQDPMAALRLLDASARHFRQMPMEFVSVLATGGRMASRAENMARAEQLLDSAVMMAARLAPTVSADDASQLRDVATASRRTLVDMALARGDTAQAYVRTVTLSAGATQPQAVATASPMPVLGPRDGELRFVVQEGSVLAWLHTARGVQLHRWTVPRRDLQHAIGRLVRRVRTGGTVETPTGPVVTLSATLLGSLMPMLRTLDHLDVYPDDVTARLPVGLLTDGTGMLLLERLAIRTVLPAGSLGMETVATVANPAAVAAAPLLIADPAWSQRDFPGLEPLRSADEEVRRIEALYPQRAVLRGADATRARVREALSRHAVVHFAGHSIAVPDDPPHSQLVLSAGRDLRDGVLYAADIAALPLRGVRLVVLSACGVLDEEGSGPAGANPLASAFIEAGSAAVIAGGWEVDDDVSAELMARLHAELQRGATPELALQRAAVLVLREPATRARRLETVAAYTVLSRGR